MPEDTIEVHPVFPWLTPAVRAWLYQVSTAVSALATGYGVVDSNKAALIVAVFFALLGSGTAALHTPKSS